MASEIGKPDGEAHAPVGLGRCAMAEGRLDAKTALRQAREISQRTGAAGASDVATELEALARQQQTRE